MLPSNHYRLQAGNAVHEAGDPEDAEEAADDLAKELMGEYLAGDTWI